MIPQATQFSTFLSDSYAGNLGLCGYLLPGCGKGNTLDHQPDTPTFKEGVNDIFDITRISLWKIISAGYGVLKF